MAIVGSGMYPRFMEELCDVSFEGLDGKWSLNAATLDAQAGNIATLELRFIRTSDGTGELVGRNREAALKDAPEHVREALQALFDLDDALPSGKEAVAEVEVGEDGKPRFTVVARDRPRD